MNGSHIDNWWRMKAWRYADKLDVWSQGKRDSKTLRSVLAIRHMLRQAHDGRSEVKAHELLQQIDEAVITGSFGEHQLTDKARQVIRKAVT